MTNKSNLIDMLEYDLVRFFDHLVVAYVFLGHPVHFSFAKTAENTKATKRKQSICR